MKNVDDVITMTYLWCQLLFSATLSWKIKNSSILLKLSKGGKIGKLITKMSWDWQLTMISGENQQFPTDFSQKFNKHSSTIMLRWQQWMSNEANLYWKWKLMNLY